MQTTNHSNIAALAKLCADKGITDVVLSPGSRNAPISIAMNREPRLHCHVVVDERCAAFVALGMAQKSNRCVATVCTSGTALLNQAPAIAEAYYQELPLLVISADRPEEWIDQADSQTLRQEHLLGNIVKQSYSLSTRDDVTGKWYANRTINEAINTATSGRRGPVHLNVPCDVPLYEVAEQEINSHNVCRLVETKVTLPSPISGKILLLAGFQQPNSETNKMVCQLAKKGVAVLAENLSNCYGEGIINNIEPVFKSLTAEEAADFTPDLLIVIGGAIVSKNAKQFLRKHPAKQTWRVGLEENIIDTFQHIDQQITCDAKTFLEELTSVISGDQHYASLWQQKSTDCQTQLKPLYNSWNETAIFNTLLTSLPEGSDLHLSNGTSVRNGQLWNNTKGLHFYANRGVSGIDGCTSTAIGSALMSDVKTTLITGDLCFLYDSNALWNNEYPNNLTIYIINNNGGGIFRKMDGPSKVAEFEQYFVTPQHVNIEALCKAYGIGYRKATNLNELEQATKQPNGVVEIIVSNP